MLRDMDRSLVVSGAGHAALILFILFGDFLFAPQPSEVLPPAGLDVDVISSEAFGTQGDPDSLSRSDPAPAEETPATAAPDSSPPPPARPEPEPAPEPEPETVAEHPPAPQPTPEPQP
ncbi:MAG: cell envelope biogenesis protein TolA, partial [Gemmobacter sp.]|nr:cell envelope biogenesis protein TolA [Gemmobacter sp.]